MRRPRSACCCLNILESELMPLGGAALGFSDGDRRAGGAAREELSGSTLLVEVFENGCRHRNGSLKVGADSIMAVRGD